MNDASLEKVAVLQTLWSGYGEVARYRSRNNHTQFVVKVINLNAVAAHPRGWNGEQSHQRKVTSFNVERAFYQHFGPLTNKHCYTPKLLAQDSSDNQILLVLEDLDNSGFSTRLTQADDTSLTIATRWLAEFHGRFMADGQPYSCKHIETLWPIGTYWHLATRHNELAAMPQSELKANAGLIAQQLQQATYKTLVHGDAKFQNLCFDLTTQQVAAVDFQYVGPGVGVQDLAYLAASCLNQTKLEQYGDSLLNQYLAELERVLSRHNSAIEFDLLSAEYQRLYPLAWADYYRFLLGWNPNSVKITTYMADMAQRGLTALAQV